MLDMGSTRLVPRTFWCWPRESLREGDVTACASYFHRAPCQAISSFHSCLLRRIHAKFRVLGTWERQVCNLQVTKADGRDLRGKECFDVWDLDVRKLTYFVKTVSRSKKKRKESSGATARSCCDNKAVFKQHFSWIQMVQVWSQYGMMINPVGSPTLKSLWKACRSSGLKLCCHHLQNDHHMRAVQLCICRQSFLTFAVIIWIWDDLSAFPRPIPGAVYCELSRWCPLACCFLAP